MPILKPDIPTNITPVECLDFYKTPQISCAVIANQVFINQHWSELELLQTRFENCRFLECRFNKSSFSDILFKSCDFSGSSFWDCHFNRCEIVGSKCVGTLFNDSALFNFIFELTNLSYSSFSSCGVETSLSGCDLRGAAFNSCKVRQLTNRDCRFTATSFFKTLLKGVNFTHSTVSGLCFSEGFKELHGAIFDTYQAAEIAGLLGIIVK